MRPCVQYIGEMRLKGASKKCKEMGTSRVRGSTLISLRQRHGFSDCFIPPPGVRVKA